MQFVLLRCNDSLEPMILDERACEAADMFANNLMENNYKSHWDLQGQNTFVRYFKQGIHNVAGENVEGTDASEEEPFPLEEEGFLEKEIKRIHRRMMTEGADGPRKKHLVSNQHTHIGFGIALNEYHLRYVEVFINRYVTIDPIPALWPATMPLEIKGRMTKERFGIYGCVVSFDHMPEAMTIEDAVKQDEIEIPEDRIAEVWPWQIVSREDG
jgi:hypothetical protein